MIQFSAGKYLDASGQAAKRFRKAGYDALRRLGFLIREVAQASIKKRDPTKGYWITVDHKRVFIREASPPGEPPLTKNGLLPRSILYSLDTSAGVPRVFVGPTQNLMGTSMQPHEHGGSYRGHDYPARPFMGPALGKEAGELPGLLAEEYGKL